MNERIFIRKLLTTKDFFFLFAKHLEEIFCGILRDDWYECERGIYIGGIYATKGWHDAFRLTCEELGLNNCYEYYNSLDWEMCDVIDADIAMLLEAIVLDEDGNRIKYDS